MFQRASQLSATITATGCIHEDSKCSSNCRRLRIQSMTSSADAQGRIAGPGRPSLPALLSTTLLLMACCVRESHGQRQGLSIPLAQGAAPRLRARSQDHLKAWAVNERLRLVGKYGDIAQGSSSLGEGSSRLSSRKVKPKKAKRQNSAGTSTTAAPTTGGSTTTRIGASASTTGLGTGSGSSNSTRSAAGSTNLTNYQSDL